MHSPHEYRANADSIMPLSAQACAPPHPNEGFDVSLARYGKNDDRHLTGATQISASSLLVARPRAMASALRAFFDRAAA